MNINSFKVNELYIDGWGSLSMALVNTKNLKWPPKLRLVQNVK